VCYDAPAFSADFHVTSDELECLDLQIISNASTSMFDFLPFGHDDRSIKSGNQNSAEPGRAAMTFRRTVFRREVHDGRRDNVLPRRCATLSRNDEYKLKLAKIAAFSKKSSLIHTIISSGKSNRSYRRNFHSFQGEAFRSYHTPGTESATGLVLDEIRRCVFYTRRFGANGERDCGNQNDFRAPVPRRVSIDKD
jgi:hypothetical protein